MPILWVTLTAFIAGAVNAVAGGGTFLAFPALTGIAGLSEKAANIGCTIGLWPGSATSVIPAAPRLLRLPRRVVISYMLVCLAGGVIGSFLLRYTPERSFRLAIPWLLGFATLVFSLGNRVARWAGRDGQPHSTGWLVFSGCVQFVIAIYGGYFGAGIGVLTLAGLSVSGLGDIQKINALKVLLSTCTNLTAAIVFLFGPVAWRFIAPMAVASAGGGFIGMMVAQRLPQKVLRGVILAVGIGLTGYYFWNVYG
ncbi:MAG TPA: sulfite exporter TauE/SafE family protein [Tepidisphaeraceae bacterium]|nr:sulfite exporter TauE/SafE family protein [Tepidisphaeraceae bacterium]